MQNSKSLPYPHQLLLGYCGKDIVCDLQALEPNPRFIIELLKFTGSERGSWMMVAAYYRRTGNPGAAVNVIKSMIEVMGVRSISDGELKPAFLLLSGCEFDLAKRARSDGEYKQEAEHFEFSRIWLYKVYGDHDVVELSSTMSRVGVQQVPSPKPISDSPNSTTILVPCPNCKITTISTLPNTSQIGRSESDIQSLRGRAKQQCEFLSEIHIEKRKLEEDLMTERQFRRKIQRQLDEADRELHIAKRMETYALEQVKREVDARRKAEKSARAEKSIRLDLAKTLDGSSYQSLFNNDLFSTTTPHNTTQLSLPLKLDFPATMTGVPHS